jgi:hypothetical protein
MLTVRNTLHKSNPYDGYIPAYNDMQGWASTSEAFSDVIDRHQPKLIVEVGTWKGASAIHMANLCKQKYGNNNFEIVCIDTFLGSVEHWIENLNLMYNIHGRPNLYNVFMSNVVNNNHTDVITPFPVDSQNGWLTFHQLNIQADMVYIDAGHDFESVKKDIKGYTSILKSGGVMLGDDVLWFPGVKAACDATLNDWTYLHDKFYWVKP